MSTPSPLPQFKDPQLLEQALTHTSYAYENNLVAVNNQRLEFLGDAVVDFVVGEMLYHCYAQMAEGELTRRRSMLVDETNLARLANQINLGEKLKLGKGTDLSGGRRSPSILSDAFEAVIGAYYLDSGFAAVKIYLEGLFAPILETTRVVNSKSMFQQWVLGNISSNPPEYRIIAESGPAHNKHFTAEVVVDGKSYGVGSGHKKQEAEKQAAEAALRQVGLL
ncbi:RNAse III [Thalassoporum mexicanum PCC 7367]|uniref:ribonuclease III n=1 Tax=Thalassoporum mexicanum TaxID=3457544 RepID=UPI00029F8506|nr:ribonuclease III [Pseudanabaena sp. PCC 7367]AFY70742.1 RNAse III [Pseudanabaena sp. PCC 7367]